MANLLVRDLPEDVHLKLQQRARHNGQSLQQYLAAELGRLAQRSTVEEVLERLAAQSGGRVGFHEGVAAIDDSRRTR